MSCIDCSALFDVVSVRAHTSCITEAEKFGPKRGTACTQTFCGVCALTLNGAVHALQHYESKKHRAAERKLKAQEAAEKVTKRGVKKEHNDKACSPNTEVEDTEEPEGKVIKRVKKAMKKILKKSRKQRLKRDRLVRAIADMLGKDLSTDFGAIVDKKAERSTSFRIRKGRISLAAPEKE